MDCIVIVTEQGVIIKFPSKNVRTSHRSGKGVRGIMLNAGDKVVGVTTVHEAERESIEIKTG